MDRTPIEFQIYMENSNAQFADASPDVDDAPSPMAAFAERAAAKVAAGGSAGLDALKEISKAQGYAPPSDDAGNIWIKHERVTVQPIESPYDAPDDDALTKRVGTSTRRLNVEKFVRTRLALGESVESLAEHAEKHDAETAALIREIGADL